MSYPPDNWGECNSFPNTAKVAIFWNTYCSSPSLTQFGTHCVNGSTYKFKFNPENPWRINPLCMPKLRTLIAHVPSFIEQYGFLEEFFAEYFEHFLGVRIRRLYCHNKPLGVQIVDDMYFPWFLSSPLANSSQQEAVKVPNSNQFSSSQ